MSTFKYMHETDLMDIQAATTRRGTCFVAITESNAFAAMFIPNSDVPTVAAELLKAAGHDDLAALIEADIDIRELANQAEAEAAEKKLQERRDALSIEFCLIPYARLAKGTQKVVDAYLELQDKLDGASRDR